MGGEWTTRRTGFTSKADNSLGYLELVRCSVIPQRELTL